MCIYNNATACEMEALNWRVYLGRLFLFFYILIFYFQVSNYYSNEIQKLKPNIAIKSS